MMETPPEIPPPRNLQKAPTARATNYWSHRIQFAAQDSVVADREHGAKIDWWAFEEAIANTVREALTWATSE